MKEDLENMEIVPKEKAVEAFTKLVEIVGGEPFKKEIEEYFKRAKYKEISSEDLKIIGSVAVWEKPSALPYLYFHISETFEYPSLENNWLLRGLSTLSKKPMEEILKIYRRLLEVAKKRDKSEEGAKFKSIENTYYEIMGKFSESLLKSMGI